MTALSPHKQALTSDQPMDVEREVVAAALNGFMDKSPAEAIIGAALGRFEHRFALVSSFGVESAVLLHIASKVSRDIPVLFLDTGKLFGETRRYRDQLVNLLGLRDVRIIHPDEQTLSAEDPKGHLWTNAPNRCCFLRKVAPLHQALADFDAWASGRKRFQGGIREKIMAFEAEDARIKVSPLAHWSKADIDAYMAHHQLPQHPLRAEGFLSVGCMPCTSRTAQGEASRAGRWRGSDKSECGIHLSWKENLELFNEGSGI